MTFPSRQATIRDNIVAAILALPDWPSDVPVMKLGMKGWFIQIAGMVGNGHPVQPQRLSGAVDGEQGGSEFHILQLLESGQICPGIKGMEVGVTIIPIWQCRQ